MCRRSLGYDTMRIALVSGGYPPEPDGIGDHTCHLAREIARAHQVAVFTTSAIPRNQDGAVEVSGVFDATAPRSVRALGPAITGWGADRVILQYNPFGFGPRGWNPHLSRFLRTLRAEGIGIDVFFHETHVPPRIGKFLVLFAYQYPQFAAVCRSASRIFVSTGRWIPQVRRIRRDVTPRLVPIGSNIARATAAREVLRRKLGQSGTLLVVFGSAHPSRLIDWIAAAAAEVAQRQPDTTLVYIGEDGSLMRRACADRLPVIDRGFLPADEAGEQIAACDVMLAPFIDGLSTRRGSVAAAFQNGVPVVSTVSRWTDEILRGRENDGIILSPVDAGAAGYASRAVAAVLAAKNHNPERLRAFYARYFDWPVAAEALVCDTFL